MINFVDWDRFWGDFRDWWLDVLRWMYHYFLEGIIIFFNTIPVPGFIQDLPDVTTAITGISGMSWALWLFNMNDALGIVILAYFIRFGIRRLPVVG